MTEKLQKMKMKIDKRKQAKSKEENAIYVATSSLQQLLHRRHRVQNRSVCQLC